MVLMQDPQNSTGVGGCYMEGEPAAEGERCAMATHKKN